MDQCTFILPFTKTQCTNPNWRAGEQFCIWHDLCNLIEQEARRAASTPVLDMSGSFVYVLGQATPETFAAAIYNRYGELSAEEVENYCEVVRQLTTALSPAKNTILL